MGSPYHTVTVSPGQPAIWSTAGPASRVSSCTRRLRNREFTLATAHPVHRVTRTQGNTVTLSLGRRSVKRTPYHPARSHPLKPPPVTRPASDSGTASNVTRSPRHPAALLPGHRVNGSIRPASHVGSHSLRHPLTPQPCQPLTGHTVTAPRVNRSSCLSGRLLEVVSR